MRKKRADRLSMFITFEGGDGSGKSTQIQKLCAYLRQNGKNVYVTREPGGLPMCERVRDVLFEYAWSPIPEALLFSASRYELCQQVILPALSRGEIVLCDRFVDSTRVYQGDVLGVPKPLLDAIITHAVPLKPDLTFLFDMDPDVAHARLNTRNDTNHMDDRDRSFHQKVRACFLDLATREPARFRVISAHHDVDTVFHDVVQGLPACLRQN